jgi:hypothetical protein
MKVQLKVHVKGYTNVHDGYCSGNECSLEDIDEYRHFIAELEPEALAVLTNDMVREQLNDIEESYEPKASHSFYCNNDPEAISRGIEIHDVCLEFSDVELDEI